MGTGNNLFLGGFQDIASGFFVSASQVQPLKLI